MSLLARLFSNTGVRPAPHPAPRPAPAPRAQTTVSVPGRELPQVSMTIAAGENSTVEGNRQSTTLILADREFYFDMVVLDAPGGVVLEDENPRPRPLLPGRSYVVRVSPSINPFTPRTVPDWQLTQNEVRIQRALELFLGVVPEASVPPGVPVITQDRCVLPLEVQRKWAHNFRLDVPADAPAATITLEVAYIEEGTRNLVRSGSRLTLQVAGEVRPVPPPTPVYLVQAVPPARTTFLHIKPEGEDELVFQGWSGGPAGPVLPPATAPRPRLPQGPPDTAAYLEGLENCVFDLGRREAGAVTKWLAGVLREQGAEASVVVVDYADSGLPWEMLRVDTEYLGTRARVVRFAEVQYETQAVALQFGDAVAAGRLVAYVHPQDAEPDPAKPEWSLLDVEPCQAPGDVQFLLPGVGDPVAVGLVYLGSGEILYYGDGDEDPMKALVHDPYAQPCQVRFNLVPRLPEPRPVFFANAPFSGRVPLCGQHPCGLAAAALSQVAGAYLGTLGPVDRAFAARVAARLWRQAAEPGGVQPAALLRDLRAEAAARVRQPGLSPQERMQAARELRYAFMYVYYGNPQARLQITPRAPGGGP